MLRTLTTGFPIDRSRLTIAMLAAIEKTSPIPKASTVMLIHHPSRAAMAFNGFTLQFPISEMQQWADAYPSQDAAWDEVAYDAGRKIVAGELSRANLEVIVRWKSERPIKFIARNSDAEIEDALRLALLAKQPRSAFGVLMGLSGVGAPMASAILTAIDQDRYTVIDWRALESLGAPDLDANLSCYLKYYFPECFRLTKQSGLSLRAVDRALWSWSKFHTTTDAAARQAPDL